MATARKPSWDDTEAVAYDNAPVNSPRMTSVSAHTATVIVVSLSVIEMEKLIETFGVADVNLDTTDKILQREFADAVMDLR